MAVKSKKTGVGKSAYAVQGKTLQEVWDDIVAKGPKNNGKAVAGLTQCKLGGVAGVKYKFEVKEIKGTYEAEARLENAVLNFSCSIKLPQLKTKSALSNEGRKAWEAFIGGVAKHELEHVKEFEKECKLIAKDLQELRAKAKDKKEDRAKRTAQKECEKAYKRAFTPAKNNKRLGDNAKALDAKTGHGPALDLSIPSSEDPVERRPGPRGVSSGAAPGAAPGPGRARAGTRSCRGRPSPCW